MPANPVPDEFDDMPPAMALQNLLVMLFAVIIGAFAAAVALPRWLPGLSESLLGSAPKVYWYLSRSAAFVAYLLLWLSMVIGMLISNKMARVWPGGPTAFDLHQYTSLIGLAFGMFHGLILMGDKYIAYTLAQVVTPFASASYRPFWVGLGQIGFYLFGIVALSFYVRKFIGTRAWRLIHVLSFIVFALSLVHGIWSGTDSSVPLAQGMYWATGGSLIFLMLYRLVSIQFKTKKAARNVAKAQG